MTGDWPERSLVVVGALAGLAGVALAAMAAHVSGSGSNVETSSRFLLWHAPVLMAAAALVRTGLLQRMIGLAAAWLIVLGAALFCGDLTLRELAGTPLFRMAAPSGGVLLMAGWAGLALAALIGGRR